MKPEHDFSLSKWPDRHGRNSGQWIVPELPGAVALKINGGWRLGVLEHNSQLIKSKYRSRYPKTIWGNRYSTANAQQVAERLQGPYPNRVELLKAIQQAG